MAKRARSKSRRRSEDIEPASEGQINHLFNIFCVEHMVSAKHPAISVVGHRTCISARADNIYTGYAGNLLHGYHDGTQMGTIWQ